MVGVKLHQIIDPLYRFITKRQKRIPSEGGILLISAGGLGDTVLFSRVIGRFLDLAAPTEKVTLLLRQDARAMAFLFPPRIRIETVDFTRLRNPSYRYPLFHRLRAAGYRLAIHTDYMRHPDLDEALIWAVDAPEAVAMTPRPSPKHDRALAGHRRFYTRWIETGPALADKVLRWARFADALTGRGLPPPRLAMAEGEGPEARQGDRPVAVLQPFSAVALKHSPVAMWRAIIAAIPAGWDVLVAGHPNDLVKYPEYGALLDLPNVRFEGAPFAQLAGILRGARMVISVDTACLHLATVLGAPTLCLASAAYVGEIMPYAPEIMPPGLTVLHAACPSQGCLGQCVFAPVDGMYPCVAKLDSRDAVAWVEKRVAVV